jgi:hypothetical protein
MDEINLENKLKELVEEFDEKTDPQHQNTAILTEKVCHTNEKRRRSVNSLDESLDYLRICIKYQNFDLAATRRENEFLRKFLEESDR